MSLIELMIVIAIAGMLLGAVGYSIRALGKGRLRSTARQLAGTIRYSFDRSMTSGQYFRVVIDLSANRFWAERSEERAYIGRDKEKSPGGGKAFDADAEERRQQEEEDKAYEELVRKMQSAQGSSGSSGNLIAIEPPPRPKRAKFQTFKEPAMKLLPQKSLAPVQLVDVYTPRQLEPYTSGRAFLYFFPDGHTERALIHLRDGDEWYTLTVHPLTGRVDVEPGKQELSRDFDTSGQVK